MDLREVVWVGIDLVPIKWVTSHCESASWSNSDHGAGSGGGGWRNRSPASARSGTCSDGRTAGGASSCTRKTLRVV